MTSGFSFSHSAAWPRPKPQATASRTSSSGRLPAGTCSYASHHRSTLAALASALAVFQNFDRRKRL